jgi:hypothetical protein
MVVQGAGATPRGMTRTTHLDAGEAVNVSTYNMSKRMTGERVKRKQNDIGEQHK